MTERQKRSEINVDGRQDAIANIYIAVRRNIAFVIDGLAFIRQIVSGRTKPKSAMIIEDRSARSINAQGIISSNNLTSGGRASAGRKSVIGISCVFK